MGKLQTITKADKQFFVLMRVTQTAWKADYVRFEGSWQVLVPLAKQIGETIVPTLKI